MTELIETKGDRMCECGYAEREHTDEGNRPCVIPDSLCTGFTPEEDSMEEVEKETPAPEPKADWYFDPPL